MCGIIKYVQMYGKFLFYRKNKCESLSIPRSFWWTHERFIKSFNWQDWGFFFYLLFFRIITNSCGWTEEACGTFWKLLANKILLQSALAPIFILICIKAYLTYVCDCKFLYCIHQMRRIFILPKSRRHPWVT